MRTILIFLFLVAASGVSYATETIHLNRDDLKSLITSGFLSGATYVIEGKHKGKSGDVIGAAGVKAAEEILQMMEALEKMNPPKKGEKL